MIMHKTKAASSPRRIGIARVLSKMGVVSRSVAAEWVRSGRVSLNGKLVRDPEFPVNMDSDRLCVDGKPIAAVAKRYVMLNKPRGLVTTARDEKDRDTVYRCLDAEMQWLAPVGRLDKASEGLLLFTNDPEWAQRLLDPATHLPKTYHVQIDRQLEATQLQHLREGVTLEDGSILRAKTARILREGDKNSWLEMMLDEGKNRHIRRMLEALSVRVLRLVRVAFGPLKLGELAKGQSRELTETELQALMKAVEKN